MKIIIRNREIDLDDPLDVMFACQYFSWDEYTRAKGSVSNVSDKIELKNFSSVWKKRLELGSNECFREVVEEHDNFFDTVTDDKCIASKLNNKDNLIIYLISHGGIHSRMTLRMIGIPDRIKKLESDFDIIAVNEHPIRLPESLYPSSLLLGCSDKNNTFSKVCNAIRSAASTKSYKKIIVMGDSKNASVALSVSHRLSDIVTNTFIIHGATSYSWEDSGWVQSYLKYLKKRKITFEKSGHLDDTMMHDISGAELYHIVKCYNYSKMNIDDRILSPFKYHDEYNIKVDYVVNEYDTQYKPFIDWLENNLLGDITIHKIQQESHNPHFIRPTVEREILPDYISKVIS